MPAHRYPWFKLWPEAMRHEKVVLLSDSTFRTWVLTLAAGSEQSKRGRFASIKHLVSVTGRPERDVAELVAARLLDVDRKSGEVWVHDWRAWQERFPSDFKSRTHREGSAKAPRELPGEEDRESTEEEPQTGDTPPPMPPPPLRGEGGRPRRRNGVAVEAPTDAELAPLSADDAALWATARHAAESDMSPSNAEKVAALEPLGRGPDGGLRLRAPPEAGDLRRFGNVVARALVDAGDAAGGKAVIVTG